MVVQETRATGADRDRFLRQIVVHHRGGDFYPDPWAIGRELDFTRGQTEAVLADLRARGWVAASPYDPERLRLTPRCWNLLQRRSEHPGALILTLNEDTHPRMWPPVDDRAAVRATAPYPAVAAPPDCELVGNGV